mmetsp:Transcript_44845/g.65832  ORF Transcript_44845/g.65832 Transcript_44845/m.65832 type:complete len:296 (+) Transcript_44845:707-1594(+)
MHVAGHGGGSLRDSRAVHFLKLGFRNLHTLALAPHSENLRGHATLRVESRHPLHLEALDGAGVDDAQLPRVVTHHYILRRGGVLGHHLARHLRQLLRSTLHVNPTTALIIVILALICRRTISRRFKGSVALLIQSIKIRGRGHGIVITVHSAVSTDVIAWDVIFVELRGASLGLHRRPPSALVIVVGALVAVPPLDAVLKGRVALLLRGKVLRRRRDCVVVTVNAVVASQILGCGPCTGYVIFIQAIRRHHLEGAGVTPRGSYARVGPVLTLVRGAAASGSSKGRITRLIHAVEG